MFEFHGWLVISPSAEAVEENAATCIDVLSIVRQRVARLSGTTAMVDVRAINGLDQLHIAGLANHRGGLGASAVDVFREVAVEFPGSYGVLYYLDDESEEWGEHFRVLVARRGRVDEERDIWLSPTRPVIED